MKKRDLIQLYQTLNDSEKELVAKRLSAMQYFPKISKTQVIPLLEGNISDAPRIYQKDIRALSDFIQQNFPNKIKAKMPLKNVLYESGLKGISSKIGSFLRPSQLKSLSQVSAKTRTSVYHGIIPTLQTVGNLKNPLEFLDKLHLFTSLKELSFANKLPLRAKNAEMLAEALPYLNNLEVLDLASTGLDVNSASVIFPAFVGLSKLKVLYLHNNPNLMDNGIITLANVLPNLKKLQNLSLNSTEMGEDGAVALGGALRHLNDLKSLLLKNNKIGNNGTVAISKTISGVLERLDIGRNLVGDVGAKALSKSLPSTLKYLNIGSQLGDVGASYIANHFTRIPNLTYLDLEYNNIETNGVRNIVRHFKNIPDLQHLGLNNNAFGDEGVSKLSLGICDLPSLHKLYLSSVNMTDVGIRNLILGLNKCRNHIDLIDVSNNPISHLGEAGITLFFGDRVML